MIPACWSKDSQPGFKTMCAFKPNAAKQLCAASYQELSKSFLLAT